MGVSVIETTVRFTLATPDSAWVERLKERLLNAYDQTHSRLNAIRHWAMCVSPIQEPAGFADAIQARGPNWRPIVVSPERAAEAAAVIQPVLAVIDACLPDHDAVAETVLAHSARTIITDTAV